jgi:hypothetical protein
VERRLSVALAAVGLLAALALFLLGRKSPDDVRAAAADLDGLIRETTAGVQARADTLAQLPRLGWAVATDEDTMRDLTTDELAFRPHPGEHIEITQMRRGGGEPRRLLRLPAESDLALPVIPGTHIVVQANEIHVVTVVSVEPRQHADELVGILAVAKQMDPSPIAQRLAARGINAELRTIRGSITLAGSRPSSVEVKVVLTGPAAEGAELVAANVGQARWPRWLSPAVLAASLLGALLLWRRGGGPEPRHEMAFGPFPTAAHAQPPAAPAAAVPAQPPRADLEITAQPIDVENTDQTDPEKTGEWVGGPQAATPAIGNPVVPEGAAPEERMDHARSGRVEISLVRSGSVSLSPRAPGLPPPSIDPKAATDSRTEEWRSLFAEFLKLRRTTGEPIEGLDAAHFVATLRAKRAEIMRQIPVKDVRFKLAFQNGKAAIRYMTVT